MESLNKVIGRIDVEFKEKVFSVSDVSILNQMRKKTTDVDERVLIDARISNVNYLIP